MIIGAVNSVFSEPLVQGLEGMALTFVRCERVAQLSAELMACEIDCGLVPVLHFPGLSSHSIISGICVSTRNAAHCEVLAARRDPSALERVGFDPRRGQANALAQVVLSERYGSNPEFVEVTDFSEAPDDLDGFVLGDEAAFTSFPDFSVRVDLGEAWMELTGYPFVHRIWVVRDGASLSELRRVLSHAYRTGEEVIDTIADVARDRLGEAAARCISQGFRYRMGSDEIDGMREFVRRAGKIGLCDPDLKILFS